MKLHQRTALFAACLILQFAALGSGGFAHDQPEFSTIVGATRMQSGTPLAQVQVMVSYSDENNTRTALSGDDGAFIIDSLKPGTCQLRASKPGFRSTAPTTVAVLAGQSLHLDIKLALADSSMAASGLNPTGSSDDSAHQASFTPPTATSSEGSQTGGFFRRLANAYTDDWKGQTASGTDPPHRGFPAPESNPPYPFTDWPYGGSVDIGSPYTSVPPLMTALTAGSHGQFWKDSKIQMYGWLNFGFNVSSSDKPGYSNLPAAYEERPDTLEPDQEVLYIERQPDTVQTDHFDWGFRIANLYGIDYRFTTAKGIFSQQLLKENREYGYDPVMVYTDLYWGQVAQGLDIRIGRYISLPDIEAQLAPNNYTYSHSLLYTYDCYTQTGINGTLKLTNRWLVQAGISSGCEAAFWTRPDSKPTLNACVQYSWNDGNDNMYPCLNALNDGKYAYNNLNSVYNTWYHKFKTHPSLHIATEWWYMWEKDVPNVNNPAAAPLLETNANGAWCATKQELTCYAPEWSVLNYFEKQLSPKDYFTLRNEYFDDMRGQRTGFNSRYTEHLIGWGHWIGSTVLFRPEIRFERSYDTPAYDNGTKKNQLSLAGDVIYFF